VLQNLEQKFKKELQDKIEESSNKVNSLENTIRRLEKEKNTLNEKLELSSKSMMSE
jgi:predicted nuclease with TOPRIM domain